MTTASPVGGTRPATVPPRAEWDARQGEWLVGERDAEGRWQGEVSGYRADGTRCSLQHFDAGTLHGASLRYHPNGEVARRASFVHGKPDGEVRSTRSNAETPERLRSCCVPDAAWSLVARYQQGTLLDQWFEDSGGRRLLSDGTPRPERPANLPESVRFDEHAKRWYEGHHAGPGGREGRWRWWSEHGELIDEREFTGGVASGLAARYRVPEATFSDARIASWRGYFVQGERAGRWRFEDSRGAVLYERDFGTPCSGLEGDHRLFEAGGHGWLDCAERWHAEGQLGLSLCALARHAAGTRDFGKLGEALERLTVPLSRQHSKRRVAELERKKPTAAHWVQALVDGVCPSTVFAKLASLCLAAPGAGLGFIDAALALDPAQSAPRLTRGLLLFEQGNVEAALGEARLLAEPQPRSAAMLQDYARLLFADFEYWPATAPLECPPNPELPRAINQSLATLRRAIAKYALRLDELGRRLVELGPPTLPWLFPEVNQICRAEPAELERYVFSEPTHEAGSGAAASEDDVIEVDETVSTASGSVPLLMRRARVEWTGLCWLCWAAGLDSVSLPSELRPRPEFAAALASAFFRVFRISDSLQTRGLRSKTRGLPAVLWQGQDTDALDAVFANMALDEAYEMRAALFFLADEQCRSPWQDDLRDRGTRQ